MPEESRTPLLDHDPSEEPVFTAANPPEAARKRVGMPQVANPRDRFREGLGGIFAARVTLDGHPAARLPDTLNVNLVCRVGSEVESSGPGRRR